MNTTKTKTSKGRRKIEIKMIEKTDSRLATRSKRKTGLFKKAAELCILTAADVAIIVKYPGGRTIHAFGHPSVEAVAERFHRGGVGPQEFAATEGMVRKFQERYDDVAKELEAEKRRSKMIAEFTVANSSPYWWNEPIDGIRKEELETYVAALEELKKKVAMRAEEMMFMNDSNSMNFSSMLAVNPNSENSVGLANYFISQGLDSTSTNSLVSYGYDFGHSHEA